MAEPLTEPQEVLAQMVAAAELGDDRAQEELAGFYQNGSEPQRAAEWMTKAADAGRPTAMYSLGLMYLGGRGVDRSATTGVEWLSKAAEAGLADAQNELGRVLHAGAEGVPADPTRAAALFQAAAGQGHVQSMVNLGSACLVGQGVPRDSTRGRRLVARAAKAGDPDAVQILEVIEREGGIEELAGDVRGAALEVGTSTKGGTPPALSPTRSALPWRPVRSSTLPVLGSPRADEKQDPPLPSVDDLDELDDVPDTTTDPSDDAAAAKKDSSSPSSSSPGRKSPSDEARVRKTKTTTTTEEEPPPPPVVQEFPGKDEAAAAAVLSRQFSLIDEVLFNTSSRAGAKGILEPEVRRQQVVSGKLSSSPRSETALDEAVRKLVTQLDADDPAEQQGARELPGRDEDSRAVAFDAEALAEAARRGHARAQYWLAQCLLSRNSAGSDPKAMEADAADAIHWLQTAAERGHGLAACQLGAFYQDGRALVGAPPFPTQQVAKGTTAAWSRGAIGTKDLDQAAKWLEMGARSTDSPAASWRLAQLLLAKAVAKHDPDAGRRGAHWAERAAKQGVASAAVALARAYLGGADGAEPIPGLPVDYARSRAWANKVPGAHDLADFAARLALVSPAPEPKKHGGASDDVVSHKRALKNNNANNGAVAAVPPPNNSNTNTAKRRRRRQRAKMQQREQREAPDATGLFGGFKDDRSAGESLAQIFQRHKKAAAAAAAAAEEEVLEEEEGALDDEDDEDEDEDEDEDTNTNTNTTTTTTTNNNNNNNNEASPDRFEVALAAAAAGSGTTAPRRASLRSAWRLRRQRETTAAAKTAAAAAAKRTLVHRKRDAAGKQRQDDEDPIAVEAAEAATAELLRELDTTARVRDEKRNRKHKHNGQAKPPEDDRVSPVSMVTSDDDGAAGQRRRDDSDDGSDDGESLELLSSLVAPRAPWAAAPKASTSPPRGAVVADSPEHEQRSPSPPALLDEGEWQTTVRQRRREKRKAHQPPAAAPSPPPEESAEAMPEPEVVEASSDATAPNNDDAPVVKAEAPAPEEEQAEEQVEEEEAEEQEEAPPEETEVSSIAAPKDATEEVETGTEEVKGDDEPATEEVDARADEADGYFFEDGGAVETKHEHELDEEDMLDEDDLAARAAAAAATEAENDALARELARKFATDDLDAVVDDGDWIPAPNKRSRRKKQASRL